MTLTRKLIAGKVLFAIIICLIAAYLTIEKPDKQLFNTPDSKKHASNNIPQREQLKESLQKDTPHKELQKQLTQESSVRKSQADRPLMTDNEGDLTLSPAITRYFEYFYSVHAEFSEDELLKLFSSDVKQHYPENFHQDIIRLFENFLGYKKAFALTLHDMDEHDVSYIMSHPGNFHDLKHGIQQQFFSNEEIEALFTEYEKQLKTPSLARSNQLKYQAYQQAKKEGKPVTMYNDPALQRLANLEQQRNNWQQRLSDYSQQRDAIDNSSNLDDYGKKQAIKALLDRLFDGREAIRVAALERGGRL